MVDGIALIKEGVESKANCTGKECMKELCCDIWDHSKFSGTAGLDKDADPAKGKNGGYE